MCAAVVEQDPLVVVLRLCQVQCRARVPVAVIQARSHTRLLRDLGNRRRQGHGTTVRKDFSVATERKQE